MPTGHTEMLQRDASFTDFAISCARAFGALITMRDDPSDAPIPDEFKPSDHHVKALEKARKELADLEAMDQAAKVEACNKANADSARKRGPKASPKSTKK